MKMLFCGALLFMMFTSCNIADQQKEDPAATTVVDMHRLPELKTVDSIDIHFFPDIKDQKIYTRFGLNDTASIHLFTLTEINHPFVEQTNCTYDTKFFCFSKGQIVKTLYLATAKDNCRFIAYIKSGGITVKAALSDTAIAMVQKWSVKSS